MSQKNNLMKNIYINSIISAMAKIIMPPILLLIIAVEAFHQYIHLDSVISILLFSFGMLAAFTLVVACILYFRYFKYIQDMVGYIQHIPDENFQIMLASRQSKVKNLAQYFDLFLSTLSHSMVTQKEHNDELRHYNRKLQQANEIIEKSSIVMFEWSIIPGEPAKFVTDNISNYGYTVEDFCTGRVDFWDFVYKDDKEKTQNKVWNARKEEKDEYKHFYRVVCQDGTIRWVEEWTILERDEEGKLSTEKSIIRDITDQVETAEMLHQSELRYQELFENASALIFTYDMHGIITSANRACSEAVGYSRDELLNMKITDFMVGNHPDDVDDYANLDYLEKKLGKAIEDKAIRKDGREIILECKSSLLYKDGVAVEIQTVAQDITARKAAEEEIYKLTFHDKLTGLYNRVYFDNALKDLDHTHILPYSIIIGDMNGLKLTNDAFGHPAGDALLKVTADILRNACPESGIIARLSGDEFAILLPGTANPEAMAICSNIRKLCLHIRNNPIQPSIALGYATKEMDQQTIGEVLREAEDNMYRNKLNESKSIRSSIISSLQTTLEEKTMETKDHAERLKRIAMELGAAVGLPDNMLDELAIASSMHDIGKIGVPDNILQKPGALSPDEWEIMKKHPEIGYHIILSSPNMAPIAEYILSHHERWDGKGYPQGLSGLNIPIISRIISIVDAYDVMMHKRPYKKALSQAEAIQEIRRCAGTQFDPHLAETFIGIVSQENNMVI